MASNQFPYYIEDWILWLGSKVDDSGAAVDFTYYRAFPVKLANYDVSFINRSCDAINRGVGFTARQLATATIIVTKYRKQIKNKIGVDVDYLRDQPVFLPDGTTPLPPHRLEVREVDRSFSVQRYRDHYQVRFPYNSQMVDRMHSLSTHSAGEFVWMKEERVWHVAATEVNLRLLRQFVSGNRSHSWNIDSKTVIDFKVADAAADDPLAHLPYLDINAQGQLQAFNTNQYLSAALQEFDWQQDFANAAFRADNYGMRIGPMLTAYIKTRYSDIHEALLLSQADIYAGSQNLNYCLNTSKVELFMQTVQAEKWVVVSFANDNASNNLLRSAIEADAPGERIFHKSYGGSRDEFFQQLSDLSTNSEVVVLTDSTMMMKRVGLPHLEHAKLLRVLYVYK